MSVYLVSDVYFATIIYNNFALFTDYPDQGTCNIDPRAEDHNIELVFHCLGKYHKSEVMQEPIQIILSVH